MPTTERPGHANCREVKDLDQSNDGGVRTVKFWCEFGLAVAVVIAISGNLFADESASQNWPQWRGPTGTGVSEEATPPTEWSETKNVRWKTALPGRGHSSPIVWQDHVFVTNAIPVGPKLTPRESGRPGAHDNLPVDSEYEFAVIAIDRRSGKIKWKQIVHKRIPREGAHRSGSLASASPVTDGSKVFAYFGSYGLYCLDFDGKLIWEKQLGEMHTKHGHGEGSSPALHGDTLVVNWDHEGESFLVALEKETGDERWRRDRQEVTSWSSPLTVDVGETTQVIVCGTERVRGYDLSNGDILWQCGGMSANIVATPVASDGILYVGSSYEKRALMAIRLEGSEGDITGSEQVLWTRSRGTPYVPSPLLYGESLYYLSHYQNVMTRILGRTGEDDPGAIRLGMLGNLYASPVGAGGYVYFTDLDGVTLVVTHAQLPKIVAVNRIGEKVSASAALVGREIFLRGDRHLFCLAEDTP